MPRNDVRAVAPFLELAVRAYRTGEDGELVRNIAAAGNILDGLADLARDISSRRPLAGEDHGPSQRQTIPSVLKNVK
jgi:hypothetical protein